MAKSRLTKGCAQLTIRVGDESEAPRLIVVPGWRQDGLRYFAMVGMVQCCPCISPADWREVSWEYRVMLPSLKNIPWHTSHTHLEIPEAHQTGKTRRSVFHTCLAGTVARITSARNHLDSLSLGGVSSSEHSWRPRGWTLNIVLPLWGGLVFERRRRVISSSTMNRVSDAVAVTSGPPLSASSSAAWPPAIFSTSTATIPAILRSKTRRAVLLSPCTPHLVPVIRIALT